MDEAERLCDRVAIMDHGKLIALGTPRELIACDCAEHLVKFSAGRRPPDARHLRTLVHGRRTRRAGRRTAASACRSTELHRAVPALLANWRVRASR